MQKRCNQCCTRDQGSNKRCVVALSLTSPASVAVMAEHAWKQVEIASVVIKDAQSCAHCGLVLGCRHATRPCETRVCRYHEPDVMPVYLALLDSPWVYDNIAGSVFPVGRRHACVCGIHAASFKEKLLRLTSYYTGTSRYLFARPTRYRLVSGSLHQPIEEHTPLSFSTFPPTSPTTKQSGAC